MNGRTKTAVNRPGAISPPPASHLRASGTSAGRTDPNSTAMNTAVAKNLAARLDGPPGLPSPAATATARNISTVTTAAAAIPADPIGLERSPFS